MKKILFFSILSLSAFGQVKISDMPAATSLTGTELIPIVQSGVNKKATPLLWQTYLSPIFQATLVSGTNIRTVNSNSLLGSGNVSVGTVTTLSVTTANGFSGTVANATTTPAITLGLRNSANTVTSTFSNTNTAARDYAWPDFSGNTLVSGGTNTLSGNTTFTGAKSIFNGDVSVTGSSVLQFEQGASASGAITLGRIIPSQFGTTPNGISTVGSFNLTLDDTGMNSDGQRDAVAMWGYNQNASGGRVNTNEASLHVALENHFIGGGTHANGDMEFHLQSTARNGTTRRHFTTNIQKADGTSSQAWQTNSVGWTDANSAGAYFSINRGFTILGSATKQVALVVDDGASSFNLVPYGGSVFTNGISAENFNGLQVGGNIDNNISIKARSNSSTKYAQVSAINNEGDLILIGSIGSTFSPSYGIIGAGSQYLYSTKEIQLASENASGGFRFAVGTGIPQRALLNSTGLLIGSGSITASTSLDVIGTNSGSIARFATHSGTEIFDFKNSGALELSGSTGTTGQVLTSQGSGSAPIWSSAGGTYYAPTTLVANATDANFTATLNGVHNILDGVASTNRVITIPTGSNGDVMKFYNTEDTRVWSFTGATVYLADRVTVVTELLYNVPCHMERIDGRWIITN